MVDASVPFANFVVPFHFTQATEVLNLLKQVKNPKYQLEVNQTIKTWE